MWNNYGWNNSGWNKSERFLGLKGLDSWENSCDAGISDDVPSVKDIGTNVATSIKNEAVLVEIIEQTLVESKYLAR